HGASVLTSRARARYSCSLSSRRRLAVVRLRGAQHDLARFACREGPGRSLRRPQWGIFIEGRQSGKAAYQASSDVLQAEERDEFLQIGPVLLSRDLGDQLAVVRFDNAWHFLSPLSQLVNRVPHVIGNIVETANFMLALRSRRPAVRGTR